MNLEGRIFRLELKMKQTNPMTEHASDTNQRIAYLGVDAVAVRESA
jgi:hypothetical protein